MHGPLDVNMVIKVLLTIMLLSVSLIFGMLFGSENITWMKRLRVVLTWTFGLSVAAFILTIIWSI